MVLGLDLINLKYIQLSEEKFLKIVSGSSDCIVNPNKETTLMTSLSDWCQHNLSLMWIRPGLITLGRVMSSAHCDVAIKDSYINGTIHRIHIYRMWLIRTCAPRDSICDAGKFRDINQLRYRPHVSGYFWIRKFFFPDSKAFLVHP